jgi:hypothetical protein
MSIYEEQESTCACGGTCGCGHDHTDEVEEIEITREEYVARLEQYLRDLKAEIVLVERELASLKEPA